MTLHDRIGRLEKTVCVMRSPFLLHDRIGRLESFINAS
ncbi:hypothetical protein AO381_0575 [Moraxella catarrhalis]|nr:hypothetical protein AO381_0575 [Moraxella catarrhalis]